jgi:hypothetical protein
MAPWVIAAIGGAALVFLAGSSYFFFLGDSYLLRYGGMAAAAFALAITIDASASKIVMDDESIHISSLTRRRSFPRSHFVSATADGGAVALKLKSGGWLILPNTGHNALRIRNIVDAWIRRSPEAPLSDSSPAPRA